MLSNVLRVVLSTANGGQGNTGTDMHNFSLTVWRTKTNKIHQGSFIVNWVDGAKFSCSIPWTTQ